jgi:hypothetical protein
MVLATPQGLPMNFTRGSPPFVFDSSPWSVRSIALKGDRLDCYGEGLRSVFKTEVVLSITGSLKVSASASAESGEGIPRFRISCFDFRTNLPSIL